MTENRFNTTQSELTLYFSSYFYANNFNHVINSLRISLKRDVVAKELYVSRDKNGNCKS